MIDDKELIHLIQNKQRLLVLFVTDNCKPCEKTKSTFEKIQEMLCQEFYFWAMSHKHTAPTYVKTAKIKWFPEFRYWIHGEIQFARMGTVINPYLIYTAVKQADTDYSMRTEDWDNQPKEYV